MIQHKKAQNSITPAILTAIKVVLAIVAVIIFGVMLWKVISPYR